jgi:hypothetical protein
MAVELGEVREKWAQDVWNMAEKFANTASADRPYYIVFAAKQDRTDAHKFHQAMKAYYAKPDPMLGILVWYVDKSEGKFEFMPELSAPFDIPLDPSLLSNKESDSFARIAEQGEKLKVLVS